MGSVYPQTSRSAWITAQRGPRQPVDPRRPQAFFLEPELSSTGAVVTSAGILLTSRECPWRCLMCDLWQRTLPGRVGRGAIPAQIDYALAGLGHEAAQVKLYNAGSFFDAAAVPREDYFGIAQRVAFARRVVVESHPRLIGDATLRLHDLLEGTLEVAVGLETSDPDYLRQLNKGFSLEDYARACDFLQDAGIAVRAFVLVGLPFVAREDAVAVAVRSVRYAFGLGATAVSLILTRPGNGAMDRLIDAGEYSLPALGMLEAAQEQALEGASGRVFADTWSLEPFSHCKGCFSARVQRLTAINLTQKSIDRIRCDICGAVS